MDIVLEELNYNHDYINYCTLLKQLTVIDIDKISKEQYLDQLSKIKLNLFHKIIVAKINNKIVGSITILIEPKFIHELSHVAHIEDVIVDSAYRSHGIGKILVNKVIEIAKEYNCYKIILDCSEKNIDFYKKSGFVPKEIQMALYLDKN